MTSGVARTAGWTAALTIAVTVACGGGGGGGGGGGPTNPPTPPGINFTPTKAATQGSCYLKQGPQTNSGRLFLEVRVNNVNDWYGVAFDLSFPSNLLSYQTAKEGGFLTGNTTLEVAEVSGGRLIVGHTRLGNVKGKTGSGLLMTLEFTPVSNGSGSFSFNNEQAFRTNSFPLAAEFIAGTVSVSN